MANERRRHFTVLLVEDEPSLTMLASATVKSKGFAVLAASNAEEAFQLWEHHANEIVLLFTDIVLPGPHSGFDLAEQIRKQSPGLPIIFSTGYGSALTGDCVQVETGVARLSKPYTQAQLSALILTMLISRARKDISAAA